MFITGYGAYEISSDPGFAVSRISMLDRGVLYAVPHIRGGGEMGRAWYERGTCSTRSIRLRIHRRHARAATRRTGLAAAYSGERRLRRAAY